MRASEFIAKYTDGCGGGDIWKKYENLTSQEGNNLSLKSKNFKKHLYHNNKLAVPKIIKFKSSTICSF